VQPSTDFQNRPYHDRALSVISDSNNHGFDELTGLGILQSPKATAETRDSSTGGKTVQRLVLMSGTRRGL